jgi:hypothetical protein
VAGDVYRVTARGTTATLTDQGRTVREDNHGKPDRGSASSVLSDPEVVRREYSTEAGLRARAWCCTSDRSAAGLAGDHAPRRDAAQVQSGRQMQAR